MLARLGYVFRITEHLSDITCHPDKHAKELGTDPLVLNLLHGPESRQMAERLQDACNIWVQRHDPVRH